MVNQHRYDIFLLWKYIPNNHWCIYRSAVYWVEYFVSVIKHWMLYWWFSDILIFLTWKSMHDHCFMFTLTIKRRIEHTEMHHLIPVLSTMSDARKYFNGTINADYTNISWCLKKFHVLSKTLWKFAAVYWFLDLFLLSFFVPFFPSLALLSFHSLPCSVSLLLSLFIFYFSFFFRMSTFMIIFPTNSIRLL